MQAGRSLTISAVWIISKDTVRLWTVSIGILIHAVSTTPRDFSGRWMLQKCIRGVKTEKVQISGSSQLWFCTHQLLRNIFGSKTTRCQCSLDGFVIWRWPQATVPSVYAGNSCLLQLEMRVDENVICLPYMHPDAWRTQWKPHDVSVFGFHSITADLLLLCLLKRLIGYEFINALLRMERKNITAQVSHETLSTHEFDKQTEGRDCPHLTHLSTEAPGSTLTPFSLS